MTVQQGPPLVVFLHIPKTGGMTLRTMAMSQYAGRAVFLAGTIPDPDLAPYEDLDARRRRAVRVLGGHFLYGIHEFIGRDASYVTLLREPVARVLSAYHYRMGRPGVPRTELREWVTSFTGADNVQVRILAGHHGAPLPSSSDEGLLEAAKARLESIAVVGLTERFDESAMLLRRRLGWPMPFYARQNVGPPARRVAPRAEVVAAIEDRNQLDRRLYDWAAQRFAAEIEGLGPRFQRDVARFQSLNARSGHVLARVQRLRRDPRQIGTWLQRRRSQPLGL